MNATRTHLLLVLSFTLLFSVNAQHNSGFTIGLNSDLFAVPVAENTAQVKGGGVELGYSFTPALIVSVGWESRLLLDKEISGYEQKNGISIGADYRLGRPMSGHSYLALHAQLIKGFSNTDDFATKAGFRWFFTDSFFLSTGLVYDHWKTIPTVVNKSNSLNWYWQLGLRLGVGKKK